MVIHAFCLLDFSSKVQSTLTNEQQASSYTVLQYIMVIMEVFDV